MNRIVLLDSDPLGRLCAPNKKGGKPAACFQWLDDLLAARVRVILPEIADYEVRRELIRAGKTASVARLDALATSIEYLPLSTAIMRLAAELWAKARKAASDRARRFIRRRGDEQCWPFVPLRYGPGLENDYGLTTLLARAVHRRRCATCAFRRVAEPSLPRAAGGGEGM